MAVCSPLTLPPQNARQSSWRVRSVVHILQTLDIFVDRLKRFSGIVDDAGFLHKIIDRQWGEEFCGSVGRQDMVRSCKIVTQRFTAVVPRGKIAPALRIFVISSNGFAVTISKCFGSNLICGINCFRPYPLPQEYSQNCPVISE